MFAYKEDHSWDAMKRIISIDAELTQLTELPDKVFETTVIKIFQKWNANTLEMGGDKPQINHYR